MLVHGSACLFKTQSRNDDTSLLEGTRGRWPGFNNFVVRRSRFNEGRRATNFEQLVGLCFLLVSIGFKVMVSPAQISKSAPRVTFGQRIKIVVSETLLSVASKCTMHNVSL